MAFELASATNATLGGALCLLFLYFIKGPIFTNKKKSSNATKLPPVPVVPGLPVLGNVLQLKDQKPFKLFTKWAEKYGPIYSFKAGATKMVVLSSTDVAKEAMVTRYSSISTRKLSKALKILTSNYEMIAVCDYNDHHRIAKRHLVTNVVGANAQKRHRIHRDTMRENVCSRLHATVKTSPQQVVDFRKVFQSELFGLTLKQAIGKNVENPIHVEELGATLSKDEIFKALVLDMMEGAIAIDWREFFPYLSWIPNKSFETKIQRTYFRKNAVMNALINQQKERIASGEEVNCFLDHLLSEAKTTLTMEQISTVLWETILESADTVLVVTEWAMYELAKDPKRQELLYQQIKSVCGSDKVSEENLSQLPYLSAIFHETLRKYSPIPLVPIRYAHEDTQLGGYHIPAGTEVCINIYGCNMDKNRWEDPDEWKPERFLDQTKYDAGDLYKTMAFGAGKRACAGPLQAMLISCFTIGRVVQEFEWTLRDGARENVDTAAFTGNKLYPISAIIKPRN